MQSSAASFAIEQGVSEPVVWSGIAIGFVGLAILLVLSQRAEDRRRKEEEEQDEDRDGSRDAVAKESKALRSRVAEKDSNDAQPLGVRSDDVKVGSPAAGQERTDVTHAVVVVKEGAAPVSRRTRVFYLFQRSFLMANVVAGFADWLKGAYTVSIYVAYGYALSHITLFFAVTALSSVVFGTVAGAVSDSFGRAQSCRLYCVVYAVSLLLTLWNNLYAICVARALGGLSTSLLLTAFESWVVAEHHAEGFDPALLQDTFSKMAVLSSASAVVAGFVAEGAVRAVGRTGPFLAPLPFLAVSLFFMRNWPENYGDRSGTVLLALANGWHEIRASHRLQLLLLCEAFFEGGLGIWLVMWTPSLDSTNQQTPFGLVFAAYTLCRVGGGMLARVLPLRPLLTLCHGLGVLSMLLSAALYDSKTLVFSAFMLYEVSTGLYSATHPMLRSSVMGDANRASVMSLFRVPLNIIVVSVLLIGPTPHHALWLLVGFQVLSSVALVALERFRR